MLSVIVEEHTFDLSLKVDGFRRYDLFFEIWVIFGYDVTDDVTYPQSPQICWVFVAPGHTFDLSPKSMGFNKVEFFSRFGVYDVIMTS